MLITGLSTTLYSKQTVYVSCIHYTDVVFVLLSSPPSLNLLRYGLHSCRVAETHNISPTLSNKPKGSLWSSFCFTCQSQKTSASTLICGVNLKTFPQLLNPAAMLCSRVETFTWHSELCWSQAFQVTLKLHSHTQRFCLCKPSVDVLQSAQEVFLLLVAIVIRFNSRWHN